MALVSFLDGPAMRGVAAGDVGRAQMSLGLDETRLVLSLRRLPVFLRVVYDPERDVWDALDQLDDSVTKGEEVHVYVRAAYAHSRGVGRFASYRHVMLDRDEVRAKAVDDEAWRSFVDELARREAEHLVQLYMPERALHG